MRIAMVKFGLVGAALILSALILNIPAARASAIDGTIDAVHRYAWGDHIGWVNFGATHGGVHVTDSDLTGYVWNTNYGWINLSPSSSGVTNNSEGDLGGYAWGEKLGWIDFSTVSISTSGVFSGTASGSLAGIISFDCTNCSVVTDWRPASARGTSTPTSTPSHTGGGGGTVAAPIPSAQSAYSIRTADGRTVVYTSSLDLIASTDDAAVDYVWVSDRSDFVPARQIFLSAAERSARFAWTLPDGVGDRIVFVRFCNRDNFCASDRQVAIRRELAPVSTSTPVEPADDQPRAPTEPESPVERLISIVTTLPHALVNKIKNLTGDVTDQIKDIAGQLAIDLRQFSAPSVPLATIFNKLEFLLPGFMRNVTPQKPLPPVENLVAIQAPLTLRGSWDILPQQQIREFVFAPLPEELRMLSGKFANLGRTLDQVGVTRLAQADKLQYASFSLPGLSGLTRLNGSLAPGQTAPVKPLSALSLMEKKNIPSEVVFARSFGELVDYNILLTISDKGLPEQKISTIAGKTLELAVRPESAAEKVMGYLLYRSRRVTEAVKVNLLTWVSEQIFAMPALARAQDQPITRENRLVLAEFEYTDRDGDGVYTASVQAPVAAGDYDIVTVIKYKDIKLGTKELRLVTVVDPEGYVYELDKGREVRLAGARVSLEWLNTATGNFDIWPAANFQQENPQLTGKSGSYSFLVPEGTYRLRASAAEFDDYTGEPFMVREGGGVHFNLELTRPRHWYSVFVDWRTDSLLILGVLIMYNFYRDNQKRRNQNN